MTNETITHEQKQQVKRILKRWQRISSKRLFGFYSGLIVFIVVFLTYHIHGAENGGQKYTFTNAFNHFLIYLFVGIMMVSWDRKRKQLLSELAAEDKELLERVSESLGRSEHKQMRKLLEKQKAVEVIAEKELLRPSQATQDETLLRAAASTDTTPQEQLLHPVPTDLRSDLTT